MKKLVQFTALLFIFFSIESVYSQISFGGEPVSFKIDNLSMDVPEITLPEIDNNSLIQEDIANADKGNPMRVGVVHKVNYTMDNSGRMDILDDGARIWRAEFISSDAVTMDVHFSDFVIPESAELYVYTSDHSFVLGKFTSQNSQEGNVFYTQDLPGEDIIIEYYEPADVPFKGSFVINKIGHAYRDFLGFKGHWGTAQGDCHINVTCPEASAWINQVNSVVCIKLTVDAGTYLCSGAMVNNVRQDKTPYVLSAEHCYEANASWMFYFNYQTNTCESTVGVYNRSAAGAVLRAKGNNSQSSDFLLLEITGAISPTIKNNLYFAGWDNASTVPTVGACIHHPGGDYKKISFPRLVNAGGTYYNYFWKVGWILGDDNKGVTEEGSSGSPLFNANKLIVGDLCCGSSACDQLDGYDYYGKFSRSWTNGSTTNNAAKLQPWLDPDNSGATSINGIYYDGSVGIEEISTVPNKLDIYPNPTTGEVTINNDFGYSSSDCNIYNLLGNLVYSCKFNASQELFLNLNNLADGIYFIKVVNNNNVYTSKLVIAR